MRVAGGQGVRYGTIAGLLKDLDADTMELAWLGLRVALVGAIRSHKRHSGVNGPEGKVLKYASACSLLGGYVEEHLGWKNAIKSPEHRRYIQAVSRSLKKSTSEHHSRAVVRHVLRKQGVALDWDDKLRIQVGASILERIFASTGHIIKKRRGKGAKQHHVIWFSEELSLALGEGHEAAMLLKPFHLPMLVEPNPWTAPDDGGYETGRLEIMKRGLNAQPAGMDLVSMKEAYQAINKLQRTAWRVNADILFLMRRCWRNGDQVGKLPAQEDEPVPAKPWGEISNEEYHAYKEANPDEVTEYNRKASKVYERNAKLVSKRPAMHSKIAQAGALVRDEKFYFVYTMDWRGRVYPAGADLTPQSDDAGKALLEFAEGKPIGDAGFYWLAVHLANTYGHDKVSNRERVAWVLENEDHIRRSALHPLENRDGFEQMWTKADKPWSFLAACQEWTAARAAGPGFITHLPVAQDGSANGLQHFAALMRDQESAEAVNLTAHDKPADIYQRVADRVQALLTEWHAVAIDEGEDRTAVEWWLRYDGDWRKLCKRPCMTLPYGVTMYGIREQLAEEVEDHKGRGDWMPYCIDLAPLVMEAITNVVGAATTCMGWLRETAARANAADMDVRWTTPCGVPVNTDYRRWTSDQVEVYVGGQRKRIRVAELTDVRNDQRSISGISPNFVHSLDAAHLMRSVNLTTTEHLAMVHDSYATLACDVDELSVALREAFVTLHSQPLLEMLHSSLSEYFCVPMVPTSGQFNLQEVLKADYFFA
jgi:DNA-directed RNA polymerase